MSAWKSCADPSMFNRPMPVPDTVIDEISAQSDEAVALVKTLGLDTHQACMAVVHGPIED